MNVFISYAYQDASFCRRLGDTIRAQGHHVRYHDGYGNKSPQRLSGIQQSITTCHVFLLLLSTSATTSSQVRYEAQFACTLFLRAQKPQVVPVILEYLRTTELWPFLGDLKRLELAPFVPHTYDDTIQAILHLLGSSTQEPYLANPATTPPPQQLEHGKSLLAQHRFAEALSLLEQITHSSPYLPAAWYLQGVACDHLNQPERAIQAYEWAVHLDPEMISAWVRKGNSHLRLAQHEDALVAYEQAVGMTPQLAHAWMRKGYLLDALERFHDALNAYEHALHLTPTTAAANIWFNMGLVLQKLHRPGEALHAYEEVLRLDPHDREALMQVSALRGQPPQGHRNAKGTARGRHSR